VTYQKPFSRDLYHIHQLLNRDGIPKKKKIILKFTNPQHNEMSNEIKFNLTLPQPNRAQKLANKLLTSGGNTTTHYNPLIHDNSSLKPSITIVTFLFFSIVIVENGSSPFFSQFLHLNP
jgi:hypothetical protein